MTVVDPDPPAADREVQAPTTDGWHARLRLRIAAAAGTTAIVERSERGPLIVHDEVALSDGRCEVVVAYPRSGIASGQRIRLKVDVTDAGQALLRTSAPVRLNRSAGPTSLVDRQLTVGDGAALDFLPAESVVGARTNAEVNTRVILDEGARFLGWEIVSLGRTADHPAIERRHLEQRLEVRRAGSTLVNERVTVDEGGIRTSTGAARGDAFATLVAVHPAGLSEALADTVLRLVTRSPLPGSVWHGHGALVVRIPAVDAGTIRERLADVRRLLAPALEDATEDTSVEARRQAPTSQLSGRRRRG